MGFPPKSHSTGFLQKNNSLGAIPALDNNCLIEHCCLQVGRSIVYPLFAVCHLLEYLFTGRPENLMSILPWCIYFD